MKKVMADIKVHSQGSCIRAIYTIFLNTDFQCLFNYRIANFLNKKLRMNIIPRIIMNFNKMIFSVDIDYRATIAGGVKICHGLGLVIGKDVIIEENVKIYQGVTLGGNNGKTRVLNDSVISQPVIRKNSNVYAGAVIIGPVVVGQGSTVGVRAIITKDVPPNSIAVGTNNVSSIEV